MTTPRKEYPYAVEVDGVTIYTRTASAAVRAAMEMQRLRPKRRMKGAKFPMKRVIASDSDSTLPLLPTADPPTTEDARTANPGWTGSMVRRLWHRITPKASRFLDAAMRLGSGATSIALAKEMRTTATGLGPVLRSLRDAVAALDESLRLPVDLVGTRGDKMLVVDPAFRRIYEEVRPTF